MPTSLSFQLDEPRERVAADALVSEVYTNAGDMDAERIERAYLDRMRRYLTDVEAAYKRMRNGDYRRPGQFPSLTVVLPLGQETVVFDAELDVQLLQVYAIHGWLGILALETAVEQRRAYPPLGIPEPWPEALDFLRATRHLLSLRIRKALIEIETVVAQSVGERLSESAKTLDAALARLRIVEIVEDRGESGAHGGPGSASAPLGRKRLAIGNRDLLGDIHRHFDDILRKKQVLALMRADLRILETRIGAVRSQLQQKTEGRSGGVELPSERAQRPEVQEIERAEAERRVLARTGADAEQALQQLHDALGALMPSLLLAIPQLQDGFSIEETERVLIGTLLPLRQRIDALYTAIARGPGAIPALVPVDFADIDTPERLDKVALRGIDVCGTAVGGIIDTAGEHPARLAMLSAEALLSSLDRDEIPQGSLGHIVAVHYVVDLLDALERQRAREAQLAGIAGGLATVGAALSLSSLAASRIPTPQAQAAAAAMRLLGNVLELPTMLYFAYSTVHQLGKLEEAVRLRVIAADFASVESVAQLAEVDAFRSGFVEGIGSEIGKMLIENVVAGRLTALKKLVLVRGYLEDLATLAPDIGEDAAQDG